MTTYSYLEPKRPFFYWNLLCLAGLKPKNGGLTGSRSINLYMKTTIASKIALTHVHLCLFFITPPQKIQVTANKSNKIQKSPNPPLIAHLDALGYATSHYRSVAMQPLKVGTSGGKGRGKIP